MVLFKRRRTEVDMTTGNIAKRLLQFALPLIMGNLFQQLYNMVDTYVIGQTHNNGAYAAVGSVAPIINILIGFFSGLAAGTGVVISQFYGAKNKESVNKTAHTALAMTFILGIVFTVLGVTLSPFLLKVMLKSDEASELYRFANKYLTIYFSGVMWLMIYNMGAGILRAVGDSQRPFYYLVISAIVNTILDFLFVFGFDMGVDGVAYATVIAQFVSAVFVMITMFTTNTSVKLHFSKFKIDFSILKKIFIIGLPAALQTALTAFSNVFVQSYIGNVNVHGIDPELGKSIYLGSWTTYSKVDQLLFLPLTSLSAAAMTFVGQNIGAGDVKRAKRGTYVTLAIAFGTIIVLMMPIIIFAPQISGIFNSDASVVNNAALLLRTLTPFYLFCCVNQTLMGALRGAGRSAVPMIACLSSFVGARQIYLYIMSNFISNNFIPIAMGYPLGWALSATIMFIYYKNCNLAEKKLV